MKLSIVARTNIFVGLVLTAGFCILSVIYYTTMYKDALSLMEYDISYKVSEIYAKIVPDFCKAVKISRAMSKDNLLLSYLLAEDSYELRSFKSAIFKFLNGYFKHNDYDGVFLVLEKNKELYTQDGMIGVIADKNSPHVWHDKSISHTNDYDINIDYDKTSSSNNEISLFVNYKIKDWSNNTLGIVGVCIHLDSVMSKIFDIEKTTNTSISFIDKEGIVQLSGHTTGISNINFLKIYGNEDIADILKEILYNYKNSYIDTKNFNNLKTNNFIGIKYIPELEWFLIVEFNMYNFFEKIKKNIYYSVFIIISILIILMLFISYIISKSEKKSKMYHESRMKYFQDAARTMFGNIYEIDITKDIFSPESKVRQFDLLKNIKNLSYSESLHLYAHRFIKKEHRKDFIETFSCKNVLQEFNRGTEHITLDCPVLLCDVYEWLRFDGYIYFVESDKHIHMYLYSKNINTEVEIMTEARIDALTGCLTRGATEQAIEDALLEYKDKLCTFFIIDIDNFKSANDTFGHAFGDYCIQQFAVRIRNSFRSNDIVGRIGGDEFVVFLNCPDSEWVCSKARQLVNILDMDCVQGDAHLHISSSIGIALYPKDGTDMPTLYRNADAAMYVVKENGKNNFQLFDAATMCSLKQYIKQAE
ncbi:MAG: GGDEF domain-containing protein [Desulfovibrio sp.]|nr:GGDEF domain-containing protein [Desulfovibrio sp.]